MGYGKTNTFHQHSDLEKAGIVKKDKRCRKLCELGSVKKSSGKPPFTEANILKL